MTKLLARIFARLKDLLQPIREAVNKINKKLDPWFEFSWSVQTLRGKIATILKGMFAAIMGVFSLFFVIQNVKQITDVVSDAAKGQNVWLSKLESALSHYPSFSSVIASMDSAMSSIGTFFSPPLTFTRIIQTFGIGDAVNSIIVCAVQGVGFVITMRLMFWALGGVKIHMTKGVK